MKGKMHFIIASILMVLVGLLRGTGGVFLLLQGNKVAVDPPIASSDFIARLCGVGLIAVMLIFVYAAYTLVKHRSYTAWKLCWIGIVIFLLGGLINGFLMFGNPFVQDQIINFSASFLIALFLILGKKGIKK